MFGFGRRYKLERVETALRAALAERDDYLRQLIVALGERDELRRQRDHFRGKLDRLQRRPDDQEALSRLDRRRAPRRHRAVVRRGRHDDRQAGGQMTAPLAAVWLLLDYYPWGCSPSWRSRR